MANVYAINTTDVDWIRLLEEPLARAPIEHLFIDDFDIADKPEKFNEPPRIDLTEADIRYCS